MVKMAAARANFECGRLLARRSSPASRGACQEIIDGKLHDQFRLDVFQGGAGTSTNMNANEVIANRALELMGHKKGEYKYCDPHDHVNRSQSTNDAYPTSLHVGMALGNAAARRGVQRADRRVPREGQGVRRHPEDGTHAAAGRRADDARPGVRRVRARRWRTRCTRSRAIETRALRSQHGRHGDRHRPQRAGGIRAEVRRRISRRSPGCRSSSRANLIEATQDTQAFVLYSSCMKSLAIKLVEGLQRPAAAVVGPALRAARDQPAGRSSRARRSCRAR